MNSWDKESAGLPSFGSSLYGGGFNQYDDKSLSNYRYAADKNKLDEALENAILKSELYGDPSDLALGQYRYYDGVGDGLVRKRRGTRKVR